MSNEGNHFDNLNPDINFDREAIELENKKRLAEYQHRDYLIHRVFKQTEEGQELLKLWVDNILVGRPVLKKGEAHDPYDIGMEEGYQTFIRNILLTCEKVEKGL